MTSRDRELARVEHAKAYQIGEFLLLCIAGEKPNGCHFLDLEWSPIDVEPPLFIATWYIPPNVRCTPDPVPYEYQEVFQIGGERDTVTLQHAGGELSVPVESVSGYDEGLVDSLRTKTVFGVPPVLPPTSEAVGYSTNWDFTEAFRRAVDKIPTPDIADWLATYTVVEIGAEVGGIAGVNHLFVRVRGG